MRNPISIAIALSLGLLLLANIAISQHADHDPDEPGPTVKMLMDQPMQETIDGKPAQAAMLEVTWGPGESSAAHRHPCPTLVYVLEGVIETRIGDGPVKRYKAGDTFYEPTMALHANTRNPSKDQPARVLAIQIHDRSIENLLIPEPRQSTQEN